MGPHGAVLGDEPFGKLCVFEVRFESSIAVRVKLSIL
jgi:hypothetical protein